MAICVLLALGAFWEFSVLQAAAVSVIFGYLLGAAMLAVAARVSRARLVADSAGLADHRLLRTVRVRWEDIASFDVARPGGPWGGFCVRAIRRAGNPVDLLATRSYALLPSAAGYDEVHRMMWTLEELSPDISAGLSACMAIAVTRTGRCPAR